jgi:hypothetical protein
VGISFLIKFIQAVILLGFVFGFIPLVFSILGLIFVAMSKAEFAS